MQPSVNTMKPVHKIKHCIFIQKAVISFRSDDFAYNVVRCFVTMYSICRIKTGSGGVCCHNARGRVRNRKSNPDGVAGGI